ncbi:MAG: DUF1501 domain-containing protein [Pirellulales bacterium]
MSGTNSRTHGCVDFRRLQSLSRRSALQIGAVTSLGLGLDNLAALQAMGADSQWQSHRPKAKACIFLFMWGGPSQLDTWDLKPNAPDEVRGSFKPISTSVPGTFICEHFSKTAPLVDRLAIVRSLTHNDPAHLSSGHCTVTGQLAPVLKSDADPPSAKDSPHIGSLLSKFRSSAPGMPPYVAMPWKALHPAAPGGEAPGQHAGWLGPAHEGMLLTGDLNRPDWKPGGLSLPSDISLERLGARTELLRILDAQRAGVVQSRATATFADYQSRVGEMLSSSKVRQAFDLSQEPDKVRDRYGRNIHGQCVLMARRLIEHGIPLVAVNWHNDGKNFWDTHGNNFQRLKDDLIPPADTALSALIEDLEQRGMLEETLIAWVGEFGRRPQINPAVSGREHWPFCYSGVLAGGGIKPGIVHGSSDKHGAYPATDPMSPQDFTTTMLHALGVHTDMVLYDRENRPHKVCGGRVVSDLLI